METLHDEIGDIALRKALVKKYCREKTTNKRYRRHDVISTYIDLMGFLRNFHIYNALSLRLRRSLGSIFMGLFEQS